MDFDQLIIKAIVIVVASVIAFSLMERLKDVVTTKTTLVSWVLGIFAAFVSFLIIFRSYYYDWLILLFVFGLTILTIRTIYVISQLPYVQTEPEPEPEAQPAPDTSVEDKIHDIVQKNKR